MFHLSYYHFLNSITRPHQGKQIVFSWQELNLFLIS